MNVRKKRGMFGASEVAPSYGSASSAPAAAAARVDSGTTAPLRGGTEREGGTALPSYWELSWGILRNTYAVYLPDMLEYYEWTVFGYMSKHIQSTFFPNDKTGTAVWMLFALPFLVRPVGALLLGWVSDTYGRKPGLLISISGLVFVTTIQGLMPATSLGRMLFVIMRALQGIFVGGESSSSICFMSESKDTSTLGMHQAILAGASGLGFVLSNTLCAALSAAMEPAALQRWGWRIPFVVAFFPGLYAIRLRCAMEESHGYMEQEQEHEEKQDKAEELGICAVISQRPLQMLIMFFSLAGPQATWYVGGMYTVTWLQQYCGLNETQALAIGLAVNFSSYLPSPLIGYLLDTYGASRMGIAAYLVQIILVVPIYTVICSRSVSFPIVLLMLMTMGVLAGVIQVSNIVMITEAFPTKMRGVGVGVSWNVATSVFGGLGPLFCAHMATKDKLAPAYYLAACFFLGLVSISTAKLLQTRGLATFSNIRPHKY